LFLEAETFGFSSARDGLTAFDLPPILFSTTLIDVAKEILLVEAARLKDHARTPPKLEVEEAAQCCMM